MSFSYSLHRTPAEPDQWDEMDRTYQITAIDGRPASPAMAAALAAVDAADRGRVARQTAINADARIIRLRAMKPRPSYGYGTAGARQLFADMANGSVARSARIAALVRARIGQLDHNYVAIDNNLSDAASIRRQHWSRCEPLTALVVAEMDEVA